MSSGEDSISVKLLGSFYTIVLGDCKSDSRDFYHMVSQWRVSFLTGVLKGGDRCDEYRCFDGSR